MAMAGDHSLCAGIFRGPALHLDVGWIGRGTRRSRGPAAAANERGLLSQRSQPDIHRLARADRAVDRLRKRHDPGRHRSVSLALGLHLFVRFYEEPSLREKFGATLKSIAAACLAAAALEPRENCNNPSTSNVD